MGIHVYKRQKDGKVKLSKSIDSVAKARKAEGKYCVSVTTKLAVAPNPFIVEWGKKKIFQIARENPDIEFEEANELLWGVRVDVDGTPITSAELGTRIHKDLEDGLLDIKAGFPPKERKYSKYCAQFFDWFNLFNFSVQEVEYIIGCERRKIAGMIDVIARDREGAIVLMDFKTRDCKEKAPQTCTYPKDAQQLAIEAKMVMEQFDLEYIPRIYSIVIDANTGETGIKLWTESMQEKESDRAEAINEFYNKYEGL